MERLRPFLPLLLICAGLAVVQQGYGLCPQDDAFISFRYAANLAEGNGLVFNPGEYVMGYSNFLWVVLLSGAEWLGVASPRAAPVLVGIMLTAAARARSRSPWALSTRFWSLV